LAARLRKSLILIFKIALSAILIYFVFSKIDVDTVWATLQQANRIYLLLALFFFVLSKIISAYRLNLYFHQIEVFLTHYSNLQLYILGMFYNLFLPGGIGGDAYKGYVIKKKFEVPTKRVVGVLVLDRLSGMLLLFLYACILILFLQHASINPYRFVVLLLLPLSVFVFWWINKRYFGYALPIFWASFVYAGFVQAAQISSAFFILIALGIEAQIVGYLFIFLVSSLVSVLPLTIGGIGSREVTFFYGALWLGLDQNTSVGISMLFFLITALVSLFGLFYHLKKPELSLLEIDKN
jgi:uncharacterized membrane protein YbhN (UPF0104 family)